MPKDQKPLVLWGVGQVVRRLRETRGLTQEALSEKTAQGRSGRVSVSTIGRIERAEDLPTFGTVERLLQAMAVTVREFAGLLVEVHEGESVGGVVSEWDGEEKQPSSSEPSRDEVYVVWKVGERRPRDPIEVKRRMAELLELAAAVREAEKTEEPPIDPEKEEMTAGGKSG